MDTTHPGHVDAPAANEELIARMLDQADLNVLRLAIYQETHHPALANMRLEQQLIWGGTYLTQTLAEEHHEEVKRIALAYLSTPHKLSTPPSKDEARPLMEMFTGEPLRSQAALDFGYEELAFNDIPRLANWTNARPEAALRSFKVIIIGAGISGIAVAVQLEQLGIDYEILDRQKAIGGTWALNVYPGARVDIPSANYQYKFEKRYPWRSIYASQPENQEYLIHCCDKYGITPKITLGTEVTKAVWAEGSATWNLVAKAADGTERDLSCNVLVSATGLFGTPRLPDIAGIETFEGKILRTTAWDRDYDWAGKRIGLIGTGSSGAQVMPQLAKTAQHVTIFQRTPQWVMKADGYADPLSEATAWLCENVPNYWNWYTYGGFYPTVQNRGLFTHDRDWQKAGGHISERNDKLRSAIMEYLHEKLDDRPDLLAKSIPKYAPWGRRMVIDSGWFDALKRDNVELVTEAVEQITPTGVLGRYGEEREFDALVFALGFQTSRFLSPVKYKGRDGMTLEKAWKLDGPRAYLGMVMPGFPNFFMLYGAPNAQPVIGTVSSWSEVWARYIAKSMVTLIEHNYRSIECRHDVCIDYNKLLDAEMSTLIWEQEGQGSYFINEHGRVGPQNPFDLEESYTRVQDVNLDDYIVS